MENLTMKGLEFAVYYDITDVAKKHDRQYNDFERIFICIDTWDYWICRIIKGYNEEYEQDDNCWLIERNKIQKDQRGEGINTLIELKIVLSEDDLSNWDNIECYSLDECIEYIDDGYGIKELDFG